MAKLHSIVHGFVLPVLPVLPRFSIPFESASLYRAVPERLLKADPVTCWFLGAALGHWKTYILDITFDAFNVRNHVIGHDHILLSRVV